MANNFRAFNGTKSEALNVQHNVAVGDVLIQADWNYMTGQWRELRWTVAKVLKTRLVLTRTGLGGKTVELRILVTNDPSWAYNHGRVKDRAEGQSEWSNNAYYLFTEGDETLATLRAQFEEHETARQAQIAAQNALEQFKRTLSVEDAESAIAALQAYITTQKEKDQ